MTIIEHTRGEAIFTFKQSGAKIQTSLKPASEMRRLIDIAEATMEGIGFTWESDEEALVGGIAEDRLILHDSISGDKVYDIDLSQLYL